MTQDVFKTIDDIEEQLGVSVDNDDLMEAEYEGIYSAHFYDKNGTSVRFEFTDDGQIDWNRMGHTITFEKSYTISKPSHLQQPLEMFVDGKEVDNFSTLTFKTSVTIVEPKNFVPIMKHALEQFATLQIK